MLKKLWLYFPYILENQPVQAVGCAGVWTWDTIGFLFLLLPHARLGNYFMFWSLHFGSCKMGILIIHILGALPETQNADI